MTEFVVTQAQPTNKGEEDYNRALDHLQPVLQASAGQSTGADVLVPAGNMPERMLPCPPESSYQEEASGERMTLEAPHDLHCIQEVYKFKKMFNS